MHGQQNIKKTRNINSFYYTSNKCERKLGLASHKTYLNSAT